MVKGLENLSDEDCLQQIQENIYMQYFVGLRSLTIRPLFTPEVLVAVRKRLGEESMSELNELVLKVAQGTVMKHRARYGTKAGKDNTNLINRGILKVDATVCPEDLRFPTDTRLLNEARLFTEQMIDHLFDLGYYEKKPRTYRKVAAEYYLNFAKKKSPGNKQIRKCKKQQLQYLRRNLKHINVMLDAYETGKGIGLPHMDGKTYRSYLVVQHIYDQQWIMYRDGRKNVKDRIVNLSKPWVRPIVRGKAGKKTEFGSKINVSETEGMVKVDRIDFNNYNEAKDLEAIVEDYKRLYGYYPQSVLVDKIYLNRENRKMLKERGIEHYGAQLGRPKGYNKEEKRWCKKRQNKRSEIEGKFGLGKLKYGMNKIRMKYAETSKAHMHLIAISMNIWQLWQKLKLFSSQLINKQTNEIGQRINFMIQIILLNLLVLIQLKNISSSPETIGSYDRIY
nr:IS5 family transposase [Membranihabitans marinus]